MIAHEEQMELVRRYQSGEATPEEVRRLSEALLADAELRRDFLACARIDSALASVPPPSAQIISLPPQPARWRAPLAWAAAAALVVASGFWFWRPAPASVRLAATSGEVKVWREQTTLTVRSGFVLQAGDWLLTGQNAAAEIEFPGETTRLKIGASAEFGVVTALPDKQLKLTTGTLRASVARQSASHPMLIRTPTAKAEVLGTKFEMSATKERTEMTVTEGRVLIARTDDESGVVVESSQTATVTLAEPVAVRTPPVAQSLDSGLLARWTFDEGGGVKAADVSAHARDLTLSAADVWGAGRAGAGLDLHAGKADVGLPDFPLPPVATISLWLRLEPSNAPRLLPILNFDGQARGMSGLFLMLRPTLPGARIALGVPGPVMGSEASSAPGVIRAGRWQHLAVTVDSTAGSARFFVDGREVTQSGGLRHDFKVGGPLLIGRRVKGGPLPFDGQLDDLRIYGRALTAAEIATLAR